MLECKEIKDIRPPSFTSQLSLKSLDQRSCNYYRFLYQSQNHMLVRKTKYLGRRTFLWFRLTDTEMLLYSKQSSLQFKSKVPLSAITFSEGSSILRGFNNCIKLEIPKNPVYWLHFKNDNERDFFASLFTKDQKIASLPRLINNQTFNPKEYQKRINEVDEDHETTTKREDKKSGTKRLSKSQHFVRGGSLEDENVGADIAQEGHVRIDQLKAYSDIYVKPAMSSSKELRRSATNKVSSFSHHMHFPSIEVSKSEHIPNVSSGEANGTYGKDSTTLHFPLPTPGSHSTKETSLFKKISFSGDKQEEVRLTINEKSTFRMHQSGFKNILIDTSAVGGDGDEIELDFVNKGGENINIIRIMEFNGVGKKKASVSPVSRDRSYDNKSPLYTYTEVERRPDESHFQEDKTPQSRLSSSQKVIGPRVFMNSVGPYLESPEQGEEEMETSALKEEIKEKDVLLRLFSGELNKKVAEVGDKSHLSLSVIDHRSEFDVKPKKINSVEECIRTGQKFVWNFELEKARNCLSAFNDQDILVELMTIEISIIEIALSGAEKKIKKTLERLQELMNKVNNVSVSQKEPEKYFSNELNKAEICIFRGAMHFFLGNRFQTVRAAAEGWRHYRKLEHLVDKKSFKEKLSARSLHRFRFGQGCFNLIFSLMPPGLLKFMRLVGIMNPSKEQGLELLEHCRKEDDVRSNYAAIALALYTIEFEVALERACDIVKDSLASYGKCPLFHWIASIICWKYAQAKDACFMIKTALWQLKENSHEAVYLIYELGWYHFVDMAWEKSLEIFLKIVSQALPMRFFKNQVAEVTALAKSLKLSIAIDFANFQEDFEDISEERNCILPHLPHIAVKLAVCYFNLGSYELAIKWLLSATVIFKSYSNFKSRYEEDFSKLSIKFLSRCSLRMLVFEVIYLMRYLPKMPDQNLLSMLEQVEEYQASLSIDHAQLEAYLSTNSKEDPFIVEYFSTVMIRIVNYCLLGDTDIACEIYKKNSKYFSIIPDEFAYMVVHIEYWVGRALVSENRSEEAKAMLKGLLKRKKTDFSINTRIRRVLADIK